MRFDYETEYDMKDVTFLVRFLSYSKNEKLRVYDSKTLNIRLFDK